MSSNGSVGNGFGSSQPRCLVIWLLGITDGATIGTCFFGNYSQDDQPPVEHWLPFHDAERATKLAVKYPRSTQQTIAGNMTITLSGTVAAECNGKYSQDGMSDDVMKYTNPEGISLFRARLYETPELGITSALLEKEAPGRHKRPEAAKKRANARGGKAKDNEVDKEVGNDDDENEFMEGDAAAREAELLRRSKSVDVYDLAGEQLNNEAFWPLRGVGLRMIVTGLREQVVRRQAYKASIEKLVEAEFEEDMARAAASLKAVTKAGAVADGDAGDQGAPRGPKIDYAALMMQAPNTTYMMSDADVVSRLPGSDRVIPTSASSVPPLCRAWVLLSCPRSATACRKRHYYVNQREREQNSEVRQAKEQSLDMDVLMNISTREALLEGAREAATASMATYLQDTDAAVVEHRHVANLLALLDRLRLASVACVEAIGRWRDHQDSMRSLMAGGGSSGSDLKGHWAVTVQVTGPELYKASAAFRSKVKRLQRGREEPKKAVEFHYLGVFPTKSDAARCYDRHIAMEAGRKGTNPNRLPAKRFVARSCGKHFVVEPEGAPRGRPCEQCLVAKIGRGAGGDFKPPYLWEGGNYLLKMLTDTEFLAEVDTLNEFVNGHDGDSPDGAAKGNPLPKYFWSKNPLLLAPELASAGSRGVVIGPSKEYQEAVAAKEAADEAKRLKKLKRRGSSSSSRRRGSSSVGDTSRSNASLQSADGTMLRTNHLELLEPLTPTTPLTGLGSGWGSGNGGADGWGSRSQGRRSSLSSQGGDRRGGGDNGTGNGDRPLDSARGGGSDGRPRVPPLPKPMQEPMSPGGTTEGGMQLDSARHTGRSETGRETGRDTERSVVFEDGTRGGTEEAAAADAARAAAKEAAREAARVAALGLGSGRGSANGGNGSDGGDSDTGSIDSKTGEKKKKRKARRRGSDSSVGSDSSSSSTTLGRRKGVLLGAYRFGSPAGAFTTTRATKSSGGDHHLVELGGGKAGKSSKHAPVGLGGHFLQSEVFGAAAFGADDDNSNGSMGGMHSGAPYEAGVEMLDMVRIRKALKDLEQEQLFATWAPSTPQQAPPDASSTAGGSKKRAKNAAGGAVTTATAAAEGGGTDSKPQTASGSRPGSPSGGSGVPAIHFAAEGEYGDTSSDDDSDDDGSKNEKLVFSAAEEAKEEERLLKLLAGKQGKQVAETLAIYEEGGASLAIPQSRPKDPTKIDGLFCRRDKGKWKGVGIPGTEMKRFEFAEKLVIEGKRRNRARDRLGLLIRVEYARPLNRVRKNRLRNLLSKATALRGSRLTLDIVTAERFLTRYLAMVKASLVVQRYTRGLFGRQAAKARTALLASKSKERRAFEVAVAAAAVDVVNEALAVGLRKATRQVLKPLYTAAKVLDGTRCVVLVRSLAHADYVERSIPVDQLPTSSSSSSSTSAAYLRGVGGGAGRPAPPPRATYSLATATYETTAAMDTTERVRPPERLLFEAYDPTTGATAGLATQEQELRVRLTSQEMNQGWGELLPSQRPPPDFSQMKAEAAARGAKARQASADARQHAAERREKKMKSMARTMAWQEDGGNLDDVSSTSMAGPEVDDDDENDDDEAQACAEAEVEHVMASIGRRYGEDKETNGHYPTRAVSRALQLQATAIDRGLNYGTSEWAAAKEDDQARRLRGLMVRPDAQVVPRTRWEPAYEATVLGAAWKGAVTLSGYMARAATWTLAMQAAAQEQVNDSFAAYERSQMAYQDAWAVLLKACAEYDAAVEGTRQALAFSAGTIADFAHPEKEDWAQSYEPFEDGNNWKQLRRKRTAGFAQAAAARNAKAAAAKIGHLRRTWLAAKDWLLLWDARAANQIRRREQAAMAAEEAAQLGHTAQANLREACDRAWSVMSLRHRSTVPSTRQLLWREHAWTLAPSADAIKASAANPSAAAPGGYENRLEKPMLRAWNHLWREARVVHSAVAPGLSAPRLSKRFLVTLRQDASLLEGGGGPGGGLSGLTTLLVESCAAEAPPVAVVLTATELKEVVDKVDPRLVSVLTHPWRPPPTQCGSEGATPKMEQAAQAQWIEDGPLGDGSCFSSEMPSSEEESDDDDEDDNNADDARSVANGSTSLSLLLSPGSKGGSTSSPVASVQNSTSLVSSGRNQNPSLSPAGLGQGSRNSLSYGSMSPEQKKAAAKARRAQAAKDLHAAKEARAAALENKTELLFAKAQAASKQRRLRVGPELDVGWREIDALAPGFRSAVTAEISALEADEIRAEAQAAEEAEALRVKKAKEKAKKEAAMDGEVATRVQQKLKAAVYGTNPTVFFSRYDSDKSGTLDIAEFKKCVRIALKVTPEDLSDADLDTFAANLDDDESGDLDIAELADFVERGTATFGETAAGNDDDDEVSKFATKKWGDKEDGAAAKQRERKLAELKAKKAEEEARARRAARRAKRRRKMDVQEMHQARAHAQAMQLAMAPESVLLERTAKKKARGQKLKVKGRRHKFANVDADEVVEGLSTTSAVALVDPVLIESRAPVPESPSSSTDLTLLPPPPPLSSQLPHSQSQILATAAEKKTVPGAANAAARARRGAAMTLRRYRDLRLARCKDVCAAILSSLKLDVFSGAITVGNVGFARTRNRVASMFSSSTGGGNSASAPSDDAAGGALTATATSAAAEGTEAESSVASASSAGGCRWWQDLTAKRSSMRTHTNEVLREARAVGGRLCTLVVYENWGDMLFEAYDPESRHTYAVNASLAQCVTALSDEPQALQAYLLAVRLNEWPRAVVLALADRVDLSLPGEDNRWWRRPLRHERPRATLLPKRHLRFRGPIWRDDRRRVASRKVTLAAYTSSRGDLKLILSAPRDEGTGQGAYHGPDLSLELSAGELRRVLTTAGRLDLLGADPEICAQKMDFLCSRLFILNEDEYWGTPRGARFAQEAESYVTVASTAFSSFAKWASATRAPVLRDLTPFFDPPEAFRDAALKAAQASLAASSSSSVDNPNSGSGGSSALTKRRGGLGGGMSRQTLVLFREVDKITQCHTLYEGPWMPQAAVMGTLDRDARRAEAQELALAVKRGAIGSPQGPFPPRSFDETWAAEAFAVRISAMASGRLLVSLSPEHERQRTARLQEAERMSMFREENLSRAQAQHLAAFQREASRLAEKADAEKDRAAAAAVRAREQRRVQNERALQRQLEWRRRTALARAWAEEASDTCDALLNALIWHRAEEEVKAEAETVEQLSQAPSTEKNEVVPAEGEETLSAETGDSTTNETEVNEESTSRASRQPDIEKPAALSTPSVYMGPALDLNLASGTVDEPLAPGTINLSASLASWRSSQNSNASLGEASGGSVTSQGGNDVGHDAFRFEKQPDKNGLFLFQPLEKENPNKTSSTAGGGGGAAAGAAEVGTAKTKTTKVRPVRFPLGTSAQAAALAASATTAQSSGAALQRRGHHGLRVGAGDATRRAFPGKGGSFVLGVNRFRKLPPTSRTVAGVAAELAGWPQGTPALPIAPPSNAPPTNKGRGPAAGSTTTAAASPASEAPLPGLPWACTSDIVLAEKVQRLPWWMPLPPDEDPGNKGDDDDDAPIIKGAEGVVAGSTAAASTDVVVPAVTTDGKNTSDAVAAVASPPRSALFGKLKKAAATAAATSGAVRTIGQAQEASAAAAAAAQAWAATHPPRYCLVRVVLRGLRFSVEVYEPRTGAAFNLKVYSPFVRATRAFMATLATAPVPAPLPPLIATAAPRKGGKGGKGNKLTKAATSVGKIAGAFGGRGGKGKNGTKKSASGGSSSGGSGGSGTATSAAGLSSASLEVAMAKEAKREALQIAAEQRAARAATDPVGLAVDMLADLIADASLYDAMHELQIPSSRAPGGRRLPGPTPRAAQLAVHESLARAATKRRDDLRLDNKRMAAKYPDTQRRPGRSVSRDLAGGSGGVGGGLLSVGAARWSEQEANRGPPSNFSARLVVTNPTAISVPIQVGLATWSSDLVKGLKARPGEELRKLNVKASQMKGATLVCRNHRSKDNRAAQLMAANAATRKDGPSGGAQEVKHDSNALLSEGANINANSHLDDKKHTIGDDWSYNHKASSWSGAAVYGPAVWVVSNSASGSATTVANFNASDVAFGDAHAAAEANHVKRMAWRAEQLSTTKQAYSTFLDKRNARLEPFLVRACAARGALHAAGHLLQTTLERRMTVGRKRGFAREKEQGFGLILPANYHASASTTQVKEGSEDSAVSSSLDLETLSCGGVDLRLVEEADHLAVGLAAIRASCEKQKTAFGEQATPGGQWSDPGYSEATIASMEKQLAKDEKAARKLEARIEELPEPLQRLVAHRLKVGREEHLRKNGASRSDGSGGVKQAAVKGSEANNDWEYVEWPHLCVSHLHSLRAAAESTPLAARADPFSLIDDDAPTPPQGGGNEGNLPSGADDDDDEEEDDPAAALAANSRPPLEPDDEWAADLPAPGEVLPWTWWLSLLQYHTKRCKLPPAACPVPCCGRARQSVNHHAPQQAPLSGASTAGYEQPSDSTMVFEESPAVASSSRSSAATLDQAVEACYRERLALEARQRLVGEARQKAMQELAVAAAQGPEGLAALAAEEARVAAKAAQDGLKRKKRIAALFRRVAQAVLALLRTSKSAAANLKAIMHAASFATTRRQLANAAASLEALENGSDSGRNSNSSSIVAGSRNNDSSTGSNALESSSSGGGSGKPIHSALGMATPGDLSFLAAQRPVAEIEADMHQLPRLLGYDDLPPLADLSQRAQATASEQAVSTFDLEARFDGGAATLTSEDAAEAAAIRDSLGLTAAAPGAQVLAELLLTYMRLTKTTAKALAESAAAESSSSSSKKKTIDGAGAALAGPQNLGSQAPGGASNASTAMVIGQGKMTSGGQSKAPQNDDFSDGGADSEEEWIQAALPKKKKKAKKIKPEDMFSVAAGGVDKAKAIFLKNSATKQAKIEAAKDLEAAEAKAAEAAAAAKAAANKIVYDLTFDLAYCSAMVFVSNQPLLLSVKQPKGSDGLSLVAHVPLKCAPLTLSLSPDLLEDLLPPLLQGDHFVPLSRRPIASSSGSSGSSVVARGPQLSPGSDPSSLAFVGSRPSMANYLLAHAEQLFKLVKPSGGSSLGGSDSNSLGELAVAGDLSGDRARLAAQLAAQRRAATRLEQERAAMARKAAWRLLCRERALERHRLQLAARRRMDRFEVGTDGRHLAREQAGMAAANDESTASRRFLACPWRDIRSLEDAFREFDLDGNGSLDVSELQDLMFALGHPLCDEAAEQLADAVDVDCSGTVEFYEFAAWWLVREEDSDQGLHRLTTDNEISKETKKRLANGMKERRKQQQKAALKEGGPAAALGMTPEARARAVRADRLKLARAEAEITAQLQDAATYTIAVAKQQGRALTRC